MTTNSDAQTRKPGDRNSFLKPSIVVTDCSSGALSARMTEPMIQSVHPIQPFTISTVSRLCITSTLDEGVSDADMVDVQRRSSSLSRRSARG